jgi:phytanoyl-CoA dioxygenase PhyH
MTTMEIPASPALPPMNRCIQMPSFELGERLTSEQTEFLSTFGFIRFRRFLPKREVAELVAEVESIDARLVAERRTHINGVPLIVGQKEDGSRYVQRMIFASLFGERLHRFLMDKRFAAILEVAGPGYRIGERERDGLVINHFRKEPGSTYKRLGWHTDSLRDLFYLEKPRRYLNVGFYLDDSPIEKGGVRLIPFSHLQGLWPMLTRKAYFLDCDPDPAEYALVAEAGDLTIHDGRIWHRVAEASVTGNASQRRVMYAPLMEGPLKPKDENSPTPLYFRLRRFARF